MYSLPYAPPQEQPSVPQSRAVSRAGVGKQRDRWCLEGGMKTVEERFWEKVRITPGCWEWTGATFAKGYGQFSVGHSINLRAHRFSWRLHHGTIPRGLYVCHKCDNPCCVRPSHLFLGNAKSNYEDARTKGRHACGTKIYRAKLNPNSVRRIRKMIARGDAVKGIARKFQIDPVAIRNIRQGRGWAHVK